MADKLAALRAQQRREAVRAEVAGKSRGEAADVRRIEAVRLYGDEQSAVAQPRSRAWPRSDSAEKRRRPRRPRFDNFAPWRYWLGRGGAVRRRLRRAWEERVKFVDKVGAVQQQIEPRRALRRDRRVKIIREDRRLPRECRRRIEEETRNKLKANGRAKHSLRFGATLLTTV